MNSYIVIRRLRGPAFLLLVGVIALLHQMDILSWGHAWPLFLILAGVLLLAERAALSREGYPPYPGAPYPDAGYPNAPVQGAGQNSTTAPGTSIVPTNNDFDSRGGQ
ncbi:MAG TPA: DUF5668 domain-containing protein [Terracidiphilus sp.]|nr:DUF5668 domain-containing protein [Terracidiphilus sp.]